MNNPPGKIAIPGSNRPPVPQAKMLGKSDGAKRIRVSIYARQNPEGASKLTPAVKEQFTSALPGKRKYLSGDAFTAAYGADPADLDKIASWAQSCNLKVVERDAKKRRLLVEGSIDDFSKAFGVQLNEYQHPKLGTYRGREGQIHVPADLFGIIQGVFGLDTRRVGRARSRRGPGAPLDWQKLKITGGKNPSVTQASLSNNWPGVFFPPQVATLYNYPANLDGTGQNVAIFAFNGASDGDPHGGYSLSALTTYFTKVLGGKVPAITDVVVQGPGNDPGPETQASGNNGDSTGEVLLDMCVVGSVAPGAHIFMYFTEFTTQGWVDALTAAITDDNDISVISISYGNPEDDPNGAWTAMGVNTVNQSLQGAIAKGVTICVASGDSGSTDEPASAGSQTHADFPASSPNVLGVGGTSLVANSDSDPTSIQSETVWNELPQGGAGGGGVSTIFPLPSYQDNAGVPANADPPHKIGRGVPDVSADADPNTGVAVIHINGKHLDPIGGTSASTPLWASLIARINQGLNARCGFLNTLLYTKFSSGVLRDITVGNNGAYKAGPGWDACSGLGSPDGGKLLAALSGKPVPTSAARKKK